MEGNRRGCEHVTAISGSEVSEDMNRFCLESGTSGTKPVDNCFFGD